jgi:catalase (peroxidase I)
MLMRQMRKQVKCLVLVLVMNHEMLSAQKWQVQVH